MVSFCAGPITRQSFVQNGSGLRQISPAKHIAINQAHDLEFVTALAGAHCQKPRLTSCTYLVPQHHAQDSAGGGNFPLPASAPKTLAWLCPDCCAAGFGLWRSSPLLSFDAGNALKTVQWLEPLYRQGLSRQSCGFAAACGQSDETSRGHPQEAWIGTS